MEIFEVLQDEPRPELNLAGHRIRVRLPLLMQVLLTAEQLVIQPIALGETVLHHLDIDDSLPAEQLCREVMEQVVCEFEPGSHYIVLRARCRFAVIDYALTQIATELDDMFRGQLRRVADRIQTGGLLPVSCLADIEPQKEEEQDRRPTYSKPHLS